MMEKRLVLALIISILILLMWSFMFPQPKQKPLEEAPLPGSQKGPLVRAQKEPAFESQPIVPQQVNKQRTGKDVVFEAPLYKAIFSTQGGVLTSFQLKEYPEEKIRKETIDRAISSSRDEELKNRLEFLGKILPGTEGVEMVSLSSHIQGIFPLSLLWVENIDLNYTQYEADKTGNNLIFSFKDGALKVIREYTFREDTYLIDMQIRLINEGRMTFPATPLIVRYGPGLGLSTDPFSKGDPFYRGLVLVKEAGREKIVREGFRRHKQGSVLTRSYPEAMWGGLENKYFLAAFLPPKEPHSFWLEKDASGQLNVGLKLQMPELISGGTLSRRFSLYLGPKQKGSIMAAEGGLEKSIDYGMLSSALRIMDILRFFYRLTRNWGLAIIMLTILTKIVFLPITQKSLHSMERMQSLQPRMKELRLKYKDDPRRMNKELMELYRREGVNPMGGCLPMLVQMPIFIALFTTLRNTIELRGAVFLWIKDLSVPDTVCFLAGIPINPLPIIMGASMFWQQKMSTADPQQAKTMMFMPFMFAVLFYNFSSGLVLYWFVQNILTIAHQYSMRYSSKKHEKK